MRALVVHNRYLERGGEDNQVDLISDQIALAGFEVSHVFFTTADWLANKGPLDQAASVFYNFDAARKLEIAQHDFKADLWVIHNIWPAVSPAVYEIATRLKIPIIQFMHNWRPLAVGGTMWAHGRTFPLPARRHYLEECLAGTWRNSKLKTTLMAATMLLPKIAGWEKSVRAWVGISNFMRNRLLEADWPENRTYALRYSFHARESLGPTDEGFYLCLGRLVAHKGIASLLAAWEKLTVEMGDKTPELIICGNGPMEAEVHAASTRARIRFVGHVDSSRRDELLRRCRAVIVPSLWWEPLGLTPYEAYEFEKPVVAAASGGLIETVQHEITGLHYLPGDEVGLMSCVSVFEVDPASASEMGRQGRRWLEDQASHVRWREQFRAIAKQALSADSPIQRSCILP